MKKTLFYVGAALAMIISLSGCNKEIENPTDNNVVKAGTPFEILANPVRTRTENDGLDTKWVADDAIAVFHAESTTDNYVKDGKFTISEDGLASNRFSGTVAGTLAEDKSYDWYMIYPYASQYTTPANTSAGYSTVGSKSNGSQKQTGNNSTAHLAGSNYPLVGKVTNVANGTMPSVDVNQACSFIEVNVTNNSGAGLTVTDVEFTATEAIVGTFYINYADIDNVVFTGSGADYVSNVAKLTVTGGEAIADKGSAKFYLGIKPFSATVGATLKVSVNGYEKEITLSSATSFTAGKIKKINFNYDQAPAAVELNWVYEGGVAADLNAIAGVETFGLGSDYAESHGAYRVKFDTEGDYIQVRTDQAIGKATIGVKVMTTDDDGEGAILVMESSDGVTFTQVESLSIAGKANAILSLSTSSFNAESRVIRFVFKRKNNVGIGPISVLKVQTNNPVIEVEDVTNIPVIGGEFTTSYTLSDWDGDDDVKAKGDGTIVTSATANNGTVTYTVAPNYTTSAKTGTITLSSVTNGVTAEIKVTQAKSSGLSVSATTLTIPHDASTATFTLTTADYGWNSDVSPVEGMNLTINPTSGYASESAQTITVSSTTQAITSTQTLGTIVVYRNNNSSDTQKRTITIRKDALPTTGTSVTWTASKTSDLGSAIESVHGTDSGEIATISTDPKLSYNWNYTRTLMSLGTDVTDYIGMTSGYIQLGKNGALENIVFSTSAIPGTIKSVSVDCASYNNAHKVSISVGGETYLASTATPKWSNNTGDIVTAEGSSSGEIVISFTDGSRALYIKSITVVYEGN